MSKSNEQIEHEINARERAANERRRIERTRLAARHAARLRASAAEDREEWDGKEPKGA